MWLHSENIHLAPKKKDVVVCVDFTVRESTTISSSKDDVNDVAQVVAYRNHGHLNARNFYTDVYRRGKVRVGRIGERSAQDAQIYYHISPENPVVYVRPGDVLRLTCHYDTMDKNAVIPFSASELHGEMCNQYLMGSNIALSPNMPGRACDVASTSKVHFDPPGVVVDWKSSDGSTDVKMGEVASLALVEEGVGKNVLWAFHRGNGNFWNKNLITTSTIVSKGIGGSGGGGGGGSSQQLGRNQFIVPHGLSMDRWGFFWATDTVLHQVFRIQASTGEIAVTLGVARVSGNDGTHFNQPTDVALSPDGSLVYISDGYGNSRVVVYKASAASGNAGAAGAAGQDAFVYSHEWGSFGRGPGQFDTPHSVAVDARGRVYVADRHNARVQVFRPSGGGGGAPLAVWQAPIDRVTPWASLSPVQQSAAARKGPDGSTWLYHVTALCYEPYLDVLFVVEGGDVVMRSVGGDELQRIDGGVSGDGDSEEVVGALRWPHDVEATVSLDGKYVVVYVAELKGKRIRKYQIAL